MNIKKRTREIAREQDKLLQRPGCDALERKAVLRAREHLAEFQTYADSLLGDPGALDMVKAWWRERGLEIDFFYVTSGDQIELLSRSVRCVEDLPS